MANRWIASTTDGWTTFVRRCGGLFRAQPLPCPLKHEPHMPQDERARNHAKRRATKRLAAHKAAAEGKPASEASKKRKASKD